MQAVPQMLQQLALPAQAGAAEAVVDDLVAGNVATGTAVSGLSLGSAYHGAISSVNFFQRMATQFVSQFSTSNAPTTTDIMERVNRIGLATGAIDPSELEQEMHGGRLGLGGFGDWRNWEHWLRGLGSGLGKAFLSAHTGQASTVGVLSVPPAGPRFRRSCSWPHSRFPRQPSRPRRRCPTARASGWAIWSPPPPRRAWPVVRWRVRSGAAKPPRAATG